MLWLSTGKLFNIPRFDAATKALSNLFREFLYAEDCDLFAHSQNEIQHLMDAFTRACTALGMTINLKKTVVMYQSTSGKTHIPPIINVYGS